MHLSKPIKTTEIDSDTVLVTVSRKSVLHGHSQMSYPSCSSTKSDSTRIRPKFANDNNICAVLADKDGILKGVLDRDDNPGLAYQVALLQDRLQLAQHIISELRAELKEEKTKNKQQCSPTILPFD